METKCKSGLKLLKQQTGNNSDDDGAENVCKEKHKPPHTPIPHIPVKHAFLTVWYFRFMGL